MPFVPARFRALLLAGCATLVLLLALLLGASWLAKPPYAGDQVFGNVRSGQLWDAKARYLDAWYAVQALDASTFIIG